ncbi:MAG: preprotein translocase subunit SecA [Crocinitomicaceae bacterium]
MLTIFKKILGSKEKKDEKIFRPYIDKVNKEFAKLSGLTNDELRAKTTEFKSRINEYTKATEDEISSLKQKVEDSPAMDFHEKDAIFNEVDKLALDVDEKIEEILEEILPEAFAVVKETARRFAENDSLEVTAQEFDKELANKKGHISINGDKAIWNMSWDAAGTPITWNMVHYDVQLYGGAVLHKGNVAEMQTGEGKTLVATLPVYLNALAGKGVHLVTVNDYLAKRDSEWMGPLYEFHGLSVDCIDKHQPNSEQRKEAYRADITFGTNNEFGFDYLRDNMTSDAESIVQHKSHYAIVDEVDSVLIDDARTPLIISGPTAGGDKQEYQALKPKVEQIVQVQRKLVNELLIEAKQKLKGIEDGTATKEEIEEGGIALLRTFRGLPKNTALIKYLSEPGIRAQLQKTENFYLQDREKEMPKIDKELYFTISEKQNSIELTDKGIDLLSKGESENYYILPDLSIALDAIENEGLAKDKELVKKESLIKDYTIKSERIHSINQLLKAYTLFGKGDEYVVMNGKVMIVDESTGRMMEGRRFSDGLHQALEAKENVKIEAATQTYATVTLQNFFRMYHKLSGMTGTAETEAQELWDIYKLDVVIIPTNRPIARKDQDDMVYKTTREKFNAVIDEIDKIVKDGRPVLVGTTTVEFSELLSRMLSMRKIQHSVLNAKYHQQEAEIVAEAGNAGKVTIATNMAGRGTDIKLSDEVKAAGGLAIVGTERHDSRRVDRQLRGRAGRQGDPGSSQFFVSLEDSLMRKFGSERIAKIMDRMGYKEGEVIQHGMISKSIERAQKKVEENNFGTRKRLLEYDDVMNAQRNAIYRRRKNALLGDRIGLDVSNMFYDVIEDIVNDNFPKKNYSNFEFEVARFLRIDSPVSEADFASTNPSDLIDLLYDKTIEAYDAKSNKLIEQAKPVLSQVFKNEGDKYKNMAFPISDQEKTMNVVVPLEEGVQSEGKILKRQIEKMITLGFIDNEWKEHLRKMDDLRTSVQHASIEQKDPLVIYKKEAFDLFTQMTGKMSKEVISFLVRADLPKDAAQDPRQTEVVDFEEVGHAFDQGTVSSTPAPEFSGSEGYSEASARSGNPAQPPKRKPVVTEQKIGRNEKVKIRHFQSGEEKELKYKQAEPLLKTRTWMLVK